MNAIIAKFALCTLLVLVLPSVVCAQAADPRTPTGPRVGGGTMIGAFFDAKESVASRVAANSGVDAARERADPFGFWMAAYNASGGGPLSKSFGIQWLSRLQQPAMRVLVGAIVMIIMGFNAIQIAHKGAAGEASGGDVRTAVVRALMVPAIFAGLPVMYATAQSIQEIAFYAFVGDARLSTIVLSGIDNSVAPQSARQEGVMAAVTEMAGIANVDDGSDVNLRRFAHKIDDATKALATVSGGAAAGVPLIGDIDHLPHPELSQRTMQSFIALMPKLALRVANGTGTPGYDLYALIKPLDDKVATDVNGLTTSVGDAARKQQYIGGYKVQVQQTTHDWIFKSFIEPIFKDPNAAAGSTTWWQRLRETFIDPAVGAIRNAINSATQAMMQGIANFLMWLSRLFVFRVVLPILVFAAAFAMEVEMFFIGLTIPILTSQKFEGIFYGQTKALFITSLWLPFYGFGIYVCDMTLGTLLLDDLNVMSEGAAGVGADGLSLGTFHRSVAQVDMSALAVNQVAAASIAAALTYLVFSVVWAFFSFKTAKGLVNGEGVAGKLMAAGFSAAASVGMAALATAGVGAAAGGSAIAANAGGSAAARTFGKGLQSAGDFGRSLVGMQDLTAGQTVRASFGGLAKTAVGGSAGSFIDHASAKGNSYRADNKEQRKKQEEAQEREKAAATASAEIAARTQVAETLVEISAKLNPTTLAQSARSAVEAGASQASIPPSRDSRRVSDVRQPPAPPSSATTASAPVGRPAAPVASGRPQAGAVTMPAPPSGTPSADGVTRDEAFRDFS